MTTPSSLPSLDLKSLVRTIPDFPKRGVEFRDITTLIADGQGFAEAVRQLCARAEAYRPDVIMAVEARGFIIGAAMAVQMGLGLVPLRKPGKLPGLTVGVDYELEYGSDRLEVHDGAIVAGQRVIIIDDLLATGGTVMAAVSLANKLEAEVAAALFVIDLPGLGGSKQLERSGIAWEALLDFEGD